MRVVWPCLLALATAASASTPPEPSTAVTAASEDVSTIASSYEIPSTVPSTEGSSTGSSTEGSSTGSSTEGLLVGSSTEGLLVGSSTEGLFVGSSTEGSSIGSTSISSSTSVPPTSSTIAVPSITSSAEVPSTGSTTTAESTTEVPSTRSTTAVPSTTEEAPTRISPTTPPSSREMKQLDLGEDCNCEPLQPFDPTECPGRRTTLSARCPCLQTCARLAGQPCSSDQPCDAEFGLRCDPDTSTCIGRLLIQKLDSKPDSLSVWWKGLGAGEPGATQTLVAVTERFEGTRTLWRTVEALGTTARLDGLKPSTEYFVKVEENGISEIALLKTQDGCWVEANGTSRTYAVGASFSPSCAEVCSCEPGGRRDCSQLCRPGESCPMCPKILVTARHPTSLTLAWDDFRPKNHESGGYVIEYKPAEGSEPWTRIEGSSISMVTLESLKPNHAYQARVFIWDDPEASKPGTASEVITVRTEDGCEVSNRGVAVGERYPEPSCGQMCTCKGTDAPPECERRCRPPTQPLAGPPMQGCRLEPVPEDPECCALQRCEGGDEHEDETAVCNYKNETYHSGQMFLDGCDLRCTCGDDLTVQCFDRCPSKLHQMPLPGPECRVVPDPHDPCCSTIDCDQDDVNRTDIGSPPVPNLVRPQDVDTFAQNENKTGVLFTNDGNGVRFEGCEVNNKTYMLGERFEDGCDARCVCDGPGHMSCQPRCPQANDGLEAKCREVADPHDACCRLILCDTPGDKDSVRGPEGITGLTLINAEALNGTAVRLTSRLISADPVGLQVWISPAAARHPEWSKLKASRTDLRPAGPGLVFEIDLPGLSPNTGYFVKMARADDKTVFSNTVYVKTFNVAVTTVFRGCLHHNRTYELGQHFEVGCELRCVCRSHGMVECQERCEVFVDTVGMQHCRWVPAPDDPCCTVPICDGGPQVPLDDPSLEEPVCSLGIRGRVHRLGERWEEGEGCSRRLCTCIRNGSEAEVVCEGRCPPLPPSVRTPTPECPQPVVVTPEDPCLCPHVVCNNAITPDNRRPAGCFYKGRSHALGEKFYEEDCRAVCYCQLDLEVACSALECPPPHSDCLEWEFDPTFVPFPPHCCAPAKCKNDGSCNVDGMSLKNFHALPSRFLDCGTRCVCVNGNLTCESRCPVLGEEPPPSLPCHPNLAYKNHLPGDDCCLHWMCRDPQTVAKELENVSVVVMNTTTVRVRFSLPSLLVGLSGHAELRYSRDASAPRSSWRIQKFARPSRLFDTPNIEYYMGNLSPDTTYFFQVHIHLDPLQGGPESQVFKIRLPPVPTTTTTTTPLPPVIRVDAGLRVADSGPTWINVTWSALGEREQGLLDGLAVHYRRVGEVNALRSSPPLHRGRMWWIARDLEPGTAYTLDLRLLARPGVPTALISSRPLEVSTPPDPLRFSPTLRVAPAGRELWIDGLPRPITRYVHLARVSARTDADAEQAIFFKILKTEKLILDQLKPGRRYKLWVDLYLTNGKTVTSNVVEFMTKASAPPAVRVAPPSTPPSTTTPSPAEALHSELREAGNNTYYVALIIVAVLAALIGLAFFTLLAVLLRRQATAKAAISRPPTSESAYDNPTYKQTYDGEKEEKNGIQP